MSQEHPHQYVVPDSIEPVVGWKGWMLKNRRLSSPSFLHYWQPGKTAQARCVHTGDPDYDIPPHTEAPQEKCTCGFYLAQNAANAFRYGYVLGEVCGWGKVIEHEDGWRTEYAYPKMFYTDIEEDVPALRAYGVPIMTLKPRDLHALVVDHTSNSPLYWWIAAMEAGYRMRKMRREKLKGGWPHEC